MRVLAVLVEDRPHEVENLDRDLRAVLLRRRRRVRDEEAQPRYLGERELVQFLKLDPLGLKGGRGLMSSKGSSKSQ